MSSLLFNRFGIRQFTTIKTNKFTIRRINFLGRYNNATNQTNRLMLRKTIILFKLLIINRDRLGNSLTTKTSNLTYVRIILTSMRNLTTNQTNRFVMKLTNRVNIILYFELIIFLINVIIFMRVNFRIFRLLTRIISLVMDLNRVLIGTIRNLYRLTRRLTRNLSSFTFLNNLISTRTLRRTFRMYDLFLRFRAGTS